MTRTYVELAVSRATHDEISRKLHEAGYDHAFDGEGMVIDMHGIALTLDSTDPRDALRDLRNAAGRDFLSGSRSDDTLDALLRAGDVLRSR